MPNQNNYSSKRLTSRSVSSCIFDSLSSWSIIVWRNLEPCFGTKETMIPIFNRTIFVIMFQSWKQFHYLFLKIAANCPHVTYCRFKSVICHLSWKKKKTFKQLPCFILKCAQGVVSNLKESHQSYFMSFSWWYNKLIFATDKGWFTLATVLEAESESIA